MKSHYYVYRVGYSKPTIKHATLEAATAESLRLSAQHPGEVFEILQCLGASRTTTTTSTSWADGGPKAEIPWIDHGGGEMPCKAGRKIEIMFRSKLTAVTHRPEKWVWKDHGISSDIIKWRPGS